MHEYGIDPNLGRSPEVLRRPVAEAASVRTHVSSASASASKRAKARPKSARKEASRSRQVSPGAGDASPDRDGATLAHEVERLFKGEPSMSVKSSVAPPQYGATRRRWFQEVPPTEWFRQEESDPLPPVQIVCPPTRAASDEPSRPPPSPTCVRPRSRTRWPRPSQTSSTS